MIRHQLEQLPGQSIDVPESVETPAFVVDREILAQNLAEMASLAAARGVELWPHAKTHRIVELGVLQIQAGASGLTVAKLGEAEAFADAGVRSLIVAFPMSGKRSAERALQLHQRLAWAAFGVDSLEGAHALSTSFTAVGETVNVYLIIDSGLGRDGLLPEEAAAAALAIDQLPGVQVAGILTHEGSVYGSTNADELGKAAHHIAKMMTALGTEIEGVLGHALTVSLGATASARYIVREPGVGQIRPGMYAINDLGQVALGQVGFGGVAGRVLTTVVSSPRPGVAYVDAGSKVLGLDLLTASAFRSELPPHGWIADRPGWALWRLSEEHGWLRWEGAGPAPRLAVGERLQLVPNHICMTVFSSGELVLVSRGVEVDRWRTLPHSASK